MISLLMMFVLGGGVGYYVGASGEPEVVVQKTRPLTVYEECAQDAIDGIVSLGYVVIVQTREDICVSPKLFGDNALVIIPVDKASKSDYGEALLVRPTELQKMIEQYVHCSGENRKYKAQAEARNMTIEGDIK